MAKVLEYLSATAIVIMSIESPANMENKVVTLSLTDEKKLTLGNMATPQNVNPRNKIKKEAENCMRLDMDSLIS